MYKPPDYEMTEWEPIEKPRLTFCQTAQWIRYQNALQLAADAVAKFEANLKANDS